MRVYTERGYTHVQMSTMKEKHPFETDDADLYSDLFTDLFEWRPQPTGERSLLLDHVRGSEDYQELKESTLGSPVFSHISAIEMVNEVEKEAERLHDEDPFADLPTELSDQLKDWSLQQAAQRGVEKASEMVDAIDAISNAGCGNTEGGFARVSLEDKLLAAGRLQNSKKLKEVIDELGRWKLAMRTVQSVVQRGLAPVSVTIGGSIADMLPSESVLLAIPELRPLWALKLLERKLLQYDKDSPEEDKEGPLVVLLDQSGSMSGTPDTIAKGLVLALSAHLAKDGRPLVCIPFSARSSPKEAWYDSRKAETLFDFVQQFIGRGTEFQEPILTAVDFVWEEFQEADILMVTDGYAHIPEFERVKREVDGTGVKFSSILIGTEPDTGQLRQLGACVAVGSLLQREDVLKGVL